MDENQYDDYDPYADPSSPTYTEYPVTDNGWDVKIQEDSQQPPEVLKTQKINYGESGYAHRPEADAVSFSQDHANKKTNALLIGVIVGILGWWWIART